MRFYVRNEFADKFLIGIIIAVFFAFERQQINLVNIHRKRMSALSFSLLEIFFVFPAIAVQIVNFGSGCRRSFAVERVRIGFQNFTAVGRHAIFIIVINFQSFDECFKNASVVRHERCVFVPFVEIADYRHRFRGRSPHSEYNAFFSFARRKMRAEIFVGFVIRSLME